MCNSGNLSLSRLSDVHKVGVSTCMFLIFEVYRGVVVDRLTLVYSMGLFVLGGSTQVVGGPVSSPYLVTLVALRSKIWWYKTSPKICNYLFVTSETFVRYTTKRE